MSKKKVKIEAIPVYQKGGSIKRPPIYVDSPNDPRLQAYNDSLKLYNSYQELKNKLAQYNYIQVPLIKYTRLSEAQVIKEANRDKSKDTWADKHINNPFASEKEKKRPWIEASKEGNLYKTLDFYPENINKELGYQYFSTTIRPKSQETWRKHRHTGDARLVYNYENVQPTQPVEYRPTPPPSSLVVNKTPPPKRKPVVPVPKPPIDTPQVNNQVPQKKIKYQYIREDSHGIRQTPIMDTMVQPEWFNPVNEDGTKKYKNGGIMKKKVQILSAPKYDTGGQWASQKGMELYTPWPLSVHQQTVADPQYRMKSTLQPVPRHLSDIEAEKGEHIVGDFNQDGAPESMAVGGKRHSEGGTPLSVPDGAFVYSDTQKLKIKDPDVLSVFDTKKAATPGKLAKKYPLNEYKALMDNPKTDPLTRKTAEMMYGNNLKKLGQLQVVQEGMKESMGIPASPQQPTMRHGGNIPKFIEGGKKSYDDYTDMGDPQQIQNREYSTQRPSPSPVRRKIQITAAPQNTPYRFDQNPVANPTSVPNIPGVSPTPGNMQQGLNEPTIGSLKPAQSTIPVSTPQYNPSMVDVQPYVPTIPRGTNKMNKILAGAKDDIGNYRGMNADDMATVALGLKALNTRKYTPWEAPVQVSYPELILESDQPIRNALSEVTNTMQQGLYAGDQKAGRAASLASQGQLLSQAAQAVGQVSNRNAQMANQYSGQIANITNERLAQERERAKRLYDGNIISAQEYQNSLNNLISEYVGQQALREQKESERAWVNKTSPYFAVDRKGMPVFKSAKAQARYQQEVLNMKSGESGSSMKYSDIVQQLMSDGMSRERAEDVAEDIKRRSMGMNQRTTTTTKSGNTTTKKTQGKYGGLLAFINRK